MRRKAEKNLAPRQFDRLFHGGTPGDLNLAAMAAEYRAKFPSKPVIAASEQGNDLSRCGWAYLCAGGSMPNLPQTTDARLLEAIPKMKPWAEGSGTNRWVLREAEKQYLVYSGADAGLDLSGRVRLVPRALGESEDRQVEPGETVIAGRKVNLPNATILWLTRE